jgi:hypothetical protein
VDGYDKEHVVAAKCDFRRQTRLPNMHFEKLLEPACLNHAYLIKYNLVVNQVMGESNCHDSCMVTYCQEVRKLKEKFDGFELHHILRCDNKAISVLARLGSSH